MTRDSVTPATAANVKIAVAAAMQSAVSPRARPASENRGAVDVSVGTALSSARSFCSPPSPARMSAQRRT